MVPYVARIIHEMKPKNVLDLGIGMGFYGAVVRQWCDLGCKPFLTRLVGVEAWRNYRNPCWDLYDEIHIITIQQYLEYFLKIKFDLILLMDVLEHFPKDEGSMVLDMASKWISPKGAFIVTTPAVFFPQTACYGNILETHHCVWSAGELKEKGFELLQDGSLDDFGTTMLTGVKRG